LFRKIPFCAKKLKLLFHKIAVPLHPLKVKGKMKFVLRLLSVLLLQSATMTAQTERKMTVDDLFNLIEQNSKTLLTKKTSVEMADKNIASAKSQRLPDINTSLSVSYLGDIFMTDRDFSNYEGYSSPHLGNTFALEAQQVVYAGGAIDAGVRLAELQKQQAEIGTSLTRQQLRFTTLGGYLDLCKIANRIQVYEKNIELTQQLIEDIKAKQQEGMALKNDITRYELQMQTLRLELTKLQNQRSIINHQLCNTLGLDENTVIIPDATIADNKYGKDGEAHWQNNAIFNAPALKNSNLQKQVAEQNVKLAKSEMLPKVAVVAADNFNGPITTMVPPINKNLNAWYVGVGIKYSISSLFKSNHKVQQARLASRQSNELYDVTAESVNNAVQSAYTNYQQSYVELETQQKNVQLAAQNYEVVNSRYLNQLALITDMVDASNIKLRAELQEVDARINIVYAYYKLCYIAGSI